MFSLEPTAPVDSLAVAAYTVPTDRPEPDATPDWERTTIVVVALGADAERFRVSVP
ncbi:MAG TPA: hypothetical protein VEB65_10885 [Solirubrobacterales bacterium]|nr:hypothetical protein [Solirubrobacterales bacterium]